MNTSAHNFKQFLCRADNKDYVALVAEKADELQRAGDYEATLLSALIACRTNNRAWPLVTLHDMLRRADRERLLGAGDRLPDKETFTLYRGVAGCGRARRVRGISWTDSYEKALWFARRFELILDDPAVYMTTVRREDVFTFYKGRHEREFIVVLPKNQKVTRVDSVQEAA